MRGGGEVSVAWPGQGHNWGEKGEEIPPVCIYWLPLFFLMIYLVK